MGTSSDTQSADQTTGLAHPELVCVHTWHMLPLYSQNPPKPMARHAPRNFAVTAFGLDYAKPSYSHLSPFPRIRPIAVITSAEGFLVLFEF